MNRSRNLFELSYQPRSIVNIRDAKRLDQEWIQETKEFIDILGDDMLTYVKKTGEDLNKEVVHEWNTIKNKFIQSGRHSMDVQVIPYHRNIPGRPREPVNIASLSKETLEKLRRDVVSIYKSKFLKDKLPYTIPESSLQIVKADVMENIYSPIGIRIEYVYEWQIERFSKFPIEHLSLLEKEIASPPNDPSIQLTYCLNDKMDCEELELVTYTDVDILDYIQQLKQHKSLVAQLPKKNKNILVIRSIIRAIKDGHIKLPDCDDKKWDTYVKKYNNRAISKAKGKIIKIHNNGTFDIRLNEITKNGTHYKYSVSKEYIIKLGIHKGKGIIEWREVKKSDKFKLMDQVEILVNREFPLSLQYKLIDMLWEDKNLPDKKNNSSRYDSWEDIIRTIIEGNYTKDNIILWNNSNNYTRKERKKSKKAKYNKTDL
tara:strand:- start:3255 stop:4541 length:1287 start_codon:yes stop_codon:yes gene_type:complete